MEKKVSIGLNIIFAIIFTVGSVWVVFGSSFSTLIYQEELAIKKDIPYVLDVNNDGILDTVYTSPTVYPQTSTKNKPINWEGLITAISGLLSFGIKTYLEQKKKKSKHTVQAYDNNRHPTFSIINELQMTTLKNFDLGSLGRTQVFKLMLGLQIDTYEEEMREFINCKFTNSADFRVKARMLILRIVERYEQKWKDNNVPLLVIDRYKALQKDRIRLLLADADTISFYRLSENTTDFSEVIFYLLTHISVILRLSLANDTLQTLRDLNGTLKTVTYNGQPL